MHRNSREDKEGRSRALQWESWQCIRGINPALLTSLHSNSQPKILHRMRTLKQHRKKINLEPEAIRCLILSREEDSVDIISKEGRWW